MSPAKQRMLAFSPERHRILTEAVRASGFDAVTKKMFGHEVFFLSGYMFAGANEKGFFVHVGTATRDEALAEGGGTAPFEPREGMTMREYLLITGVDEDAAALARWLTAAALFIANQPPKTAKKRVGAD